MATDLKNIESNVRILNAIEFAILTYARSQKVVANPYQYFSERLGYKSKNYLYRWFQDRGMVKIGLEDLKKIILITGDKELANILCEEIKKWVQ